MKNIFTAFFLLVFYSIFSQSTNQNYLHIVEPKSPTTIAQIEALNGVYNDDFLESVEYIDGFDKNLQTIFKRFNPEYKDVANFYEYDEFGKQTKNYFPFFVNQNPLDFITNPKQLQSIYYQDKFGDLTPFSEQVYDNSPLNRVVKISKGGDVRKVVSNSNSDKTIKLHYTTNVENEIKKYNINNDGELISTSYYNKWTLQKSVTKNENWKPEDGDLNTSQVFTDDAGRKIADVTMVMEGGIVNKLVTQYVYDDKGLLRFVLSPQIDRFTFNSYYQDSQTLRIPYKKFLANENVSGGGSVTVSINSGNLSVSFSAGFNSTSLKIGQILYLGDGIPNVDLGFIACNTCSNNYKIFVENGYLTIGINTYPISTTGFNGTNTATIFNQNFIFLSEEEILNRYAHQYKYDNLNRLIEKKSPGKGWEYIVYDQFDRQILVQDEKLKLSNKWLFTKYDVYGRVIYTGDYFSSSSRENLQNEVDNYYLNNQNINSFENRISGSNTISGLNINYSNLCFPIDNIQILSVLYFDDYGFDDSDMPIIPVLVEGQNVSTNVRGLLTCNIIRTLDENTFTKVFNFYDERGIPIYVHKKNHLNGHTIIKYKYDFRGNLLESKKFHKKDSAVVLETTIETKYQYDHAERIVSESMKVNNQPEESIVKYTYDKIGNLSEKMVGGLSSSPNSLQTVSYSNDIIGQLTKINNPNNLGTNLFGLELKYENPDSQSTPLYNGSISQMNWKSSLTGTGLKSYSYSYDKLNRLKDARYSNSNFPNHTSSYSEKLEYDINGNIKFIHRSGDVLSQPNLEWMDYLGFAYEGNKLIKVKETGHLHEGFLAYNAQFNGINTYEYDVNGNLIKDWYKLIDITYNDLNLVKEIYFDNGNILRFKYDASGNQLSKQYISYNGVTTTHYLDGFQYENEELKFFSTTEGYVSKNGNNFKFVYIYTDHLGNNRLSYSDLNGDGDITENEILSSTDYYPYGTPHSGEFISGIASNFPYKFQGKEFNQEQNLRLFNFGSRMYDPYIGRWISQDPQNQYVSPYLALGNNPVSYIDPNGEYAFWDDVVVFVVGGTINVIANWNDIDNFGDGLAYFGIGGTAGLATYYGGPAAGGLVLGGLNNVYGQYKHNDYSFNNFDYGSTIKASAFGTISGYVGGHASTYMGQHLGKLFSGIQNEAVRSFTTNVTTGFSSGFVFGTTTGFIEGKSVEDSFVQGFQQAKIGAFTATIGYTGDRVRAHVNKNSVEVKSASSKSETDQDKALKKFYELEAANKKLDVVNAAAKGAIQYGAKNDAFLSFASRAKQPFGVLDVAVHGSPNSVQIGSYNVSHRVLANLIARNPQFYGQPIRLLSCNTGCLSNGFAQNLSNSLGVPVSAPNNLIWAYPNGVLTIGINPVINNGSFINFTPGGQ